MRDLQARSQLDYPFTRVEGRNSASAHAGADRSPFDWTVTQEHTNPPARVRIHILERRLVRLLVHRAEIAIVVV